MSSVEELAKKIKDKKLGKSVASLVEFSKAVDEAGTTILAQAIQAILSEQSESKKDLQKAIESLSEVVISSSQKVDGKEILLAVAKLSEVLVEVKAALASTEPKDVVVKNLVGFPKSFSIDNFPEQKEFPAQMDVRLLGKPEFSELEPDDVSIERNRDNFITRITERYGKTAVTYTFTRDYIGNATKITRTVV